MILATCFTNIEDLEDEQWPTEFATPPRPGDWVQSAGGKLAFIVRITHAMRVHDVKKPDRLEAYVRVELCR